MDDHNILDRIKKLVQEEHELRSGVPLGSAGEADTVGRLRRLEEDLDQCWDLLRQRRAKREFAEDDQEATARPIAEVEGYIQ